MKVKVKERVNWPITILLILGLVTVIFPLYLTVVIAFKKPSEMTNSISGILSLPKSWSFSNFAEAMRVTDFWHSLGNSVLITIVTVVLSILIHSMIGYVIGRSKSTSKFYKVAYLYIVSVQGFRGGKGILSGWFIAWTIDWRIGLLIGVVFFVTYLITKYVSLGSVLASITFAVGFVVFQHDHVYVMAGGIFMGALCVFMHRANILRLIHGEERKTNLFGKGSKS